MLIVIILLVLLALVLVAESLNFDKPIDIQEKEERLQYCPFCANKLFINSSLSCSICHRNMPDLDAKMNQWKSLYKISIKDFNEYMKKRTEARERE